RRLTAGVHDQPHPCSVARPPARRSVGERTARPGTHRLMTTVLTGGVFDLLHPGHLRLLERAACLGDRLVVAVQEDDAVCAVAGKQRPVMSTVERVEMVGALRCVDAVTTYRSGTDGQIVREVAPDVLVHGHDWHRQADRSR